MQNVTLSSKDSFIQPLPTAVREEITKKSNDEIPKDVSACLQRVHEELIHRRYRPEMVQLFQSRHIPISTLPVLDLGDRGGGTGCINMLTITDMDNPIMRFKDLSDRPGIAFHIEGYADGQVELDRPEPPIPIRRIAGVLAVYKRYIVGIRWGVGVNGDLNKAMFKLHNDSHNEKGHVGPRIIQCTSCPRGMNSDDEVDYTTLANLLDGRDPFFRIAQGYTPAARCSLQAPAQEEEKKMPAKNK